MDSPCSGLRRRGLGILLGVFFVLFGAGDESRVCLEPFLLRILGGLKDMRRTLRTFALLDRLVSMIESYLDNIVQKSLKKKGGSLLGLLPDANCPSNSVDGSTYTY